MASFDAFAPVDFDDPFFLDIGGWEVRNPTSTGLELDYGGGSVTTFTGTSLAYDDFDVIVGSVTSIEGRLSGAPPPQTRHGGVAVLPYAWPKPCFRAPLNPYEKNAQLHSCYPSEILA